MNLFRKCLETDTSADADGGRWAAELAASTEATADTSIDANESIVASHSGKALSIVAATAAAPSSIDAATESGSHGGRVVELGGEVHV